MKTLRLLAAAALALLASACIFHRHHRHHVHDQVYGVPPGHARHAHGHACGHVLVDGVWVVVGVGHRGHH